MTTKRTTIIGTSLRISRFFGPDNDKFDIDSMLDEPAGPTPPENEDNKDKDKDNQRQQRPPKDKDKDKEKDKDKNKEEKSDFELTLEGHEEEEQEEEEEEEEEEEDKDKDKNKEDKDKKKNDKEESNKILREQRDKYKKELEAFGKLTPALAKEFDSFLETRFNGQIPTEEELRGEFALIVDKDAEIQRLSDEIASKDAKLADIDIRHSPEFEKQYAKPYNAAAEGLFLEVANLNGEGKALAHAETTAFFDGLLKMETLDGVKVKQELTRFAQNFEKITGETYRAPSVAAVMTALRQVQEARSTMNEAYKSWSSKKSEAITKRQKEEEENHKATVARNERVRKSQALEAMREFDLSSIEGFMDDKAFTKTYNEEFQFIEAAMKDPAKIPPFKEMMLRGWKARAFDGLLKEYQELKKFKDAQEKKGKNGSRGGGGDDKNDDKDDDWDDGKLD